MIRARDLFALGCVLIVSSACEGDGSSGDGLLIQNEIIAPNCTPAAGSFPSGLAVLSENVARAALVQFSPPGLFIYGIDSERPAAIAFRGIGADSDGDGLDDASAIAPILGFPLSPVMGEIEAPDDHLALVSTSNYEQVLIFDPATATSLPVTVEVPTSIPPSRFPLLPAPGRSETRVGISTLACIFPPDPTDSDGGTIASEDACGGSAPSYLTSLTTGKAIAAKRLFVATSNLARGERYNPGTILVYDWIESASGITVRPSSDVPVLFTSGFNPTGMTRFVTPGGRELLLVTITGAIRTGTGANNVLTEAAVDVIDPTLLRIVATIPLGFAGPSFSGATVEPGGRVAWLGATSERQLYAVDLRALDNPSLYDPSGSIVILDGLSLGADDARIFDADRPLRIQDRLDRPSSIDCQGFTHVTTNAAGSEAYALDFCDGTLTRVRFDLTGSPPIPYPTDRFQVTAQSAPFAPNDAIGELRSPSFIAARAGIPGVDFTTPDVLVVVGQPDAQLCSLRVESF